MAIAKTVNATRDYQYLHKIGVLLQKIEGILSQKICGSAHPYFKKDLQTKKECLFLRRCFLFFQIKSIDLLKLYFGKNSAITLGLPFDFELKDLVKIFLGCLWDPKQKVSYVLFTHNRFDTLLRFYKGKACEFNAFEDWMRNKRFRESIGLFIKFMGNKPIEKNDNEDFKKFNNGYIIEQAYSPPSEIR